MSCSINTLLFAACIFMLQIHVDLENQEVKSDNKGEDICDEKAKKGSPAWDYLKTVCPKSPLRTNLDKLQKTLRFEKISSKDKFHTVNTHTFNQQRLGEKLALMWIKGNQPFRIEPCYQCSAISGALL